jgi:hypothetical protein
MNKYYIVYQHNQTCGSQIYSIKKALKEHSSRVRFLCRPSDGRVDENDLTGIVEYLNQ